jgi:two-component system nitrate/nitrite response regulator NarL
VTRVLIVEDHPIVAQGLELGLRVEGFDVSSTDGDPVALPAVLASFSPDVVLLDLYLAGGRSGISLMPMLRAPGRTVIVLTSETEPTVLVRALDAGADAVLGKTMPFPQLVREIRAIPGGHSVEADNRRHQLQRQARATEKERAARLAPFAALTPREEEVLSMLVDGVRADDIAEAAFVSLSTVRSQIRSTLAKLGVSSQLGAVSLAVKAGWVPRRHPPAGTPKTPETPPPHDGA